MKVVLAIILITILAPSVFANSDTPADILGLYSDSEGFDTCLDDVGSLQVVELFLILKNPSFDTLHGFEVGISHPVLVEVVNTSFANTEAVNAGSEDNMIVSFDTPTTTETLTLLATVSLLYLDNQYASYFLDLVGADPGVLDPLYPALELAEGQWIQAQTNTTSGTEHVFQINWCGVPVQGVSFDRVKSLYR